MAELLAVLYGLVVLLCLAAAGRYVRRHGLSRVPLPDSTQLVGMTIVEAFQSECKGGALQEMEFMKKSWREDGENGDDIEMHDSRAQGPQQSRLVRQQTFADRGRLRGTVE